MKPSKRILTTDLDANYFSAYHDQMLMFYPLLLLRNPVWCKIASFPRDGMFRDPPA